MKISYTACSCCSSPRAGYPKDSCDKISHSEFSILTASKIQIDCGVGGKRRHKDMRSLF